MDPQLLIVSGVLAAAITLIVTEWLRIDVVALAAMIALTLTRVITPEDARAGFSSNAVWAVMAVMIMGRGLSFAGITERLADLILRVAGTGIRRITSTVSLTVGAMSGFVQNIGAAALFLPVLKEVARREEIPVSRLLMPMGFAALLGGTLTMVGTSSLIVLNDLLALEGLEPFGLFHPAPIGLLLLLGGIGYFAAFGSRIFPTRGEEEALNPGRTLLDVWGLSDSLYTLRIPAGSRLSGRTLEECRMGADYDLNLLEVRNGPRRDNDIWKPIRFEPHQQLVVQGRREDADAFADAYELDLVEEGTKISPASENAYLEVVIPARSRLAGRTLREVPMRSRYNAQVVLFFSEGEVIEEHVADRTIQPGDTLVLEVKRESLRFFSDSEDFIAVTPLAYEPSRPEKAGLATASFLAAIGAVFAFELPISIGFLAGVLAMVLGGVLTMEEAYRAVDWKVIFLIAGLIPLGVAIETSGAAALVGEALVGTVQGVHPFAILLALGVLMSALSLVISNVAATVLMVPLVLELSGVGGLTGEVLALQTGLCATNAFILPTHQVNALLMSPGGYRISDYVRAGSLVSAGFILITTTVLYFFYL